MVAVTAQTVQTGHHLEGSLLSVLRLYYGIACGKKTYFVCHCSFTFRCSLLEKFNKMVNMDDCITLGCPHFLCDYDGHASRVPSVKIMTTLDTGHVSKMMAPMT